MALDALRKAQEAAGAPPQPRRGHFAQTAFRGHDGTIYPSGPYHNIDLLPANARTYGFTDGFLGHDGQFYDRKQAAAALEAAAPNDWRRATNSGDVVDEVHSNNWVGAKEVVHGADAAIDEMLERKRPHPAGFR